MAPGETLIGKGQMALHQKRFINTRPFSGNIYVTDRRACFYISMGNGPEMDLPIADIKVFPRRRP